MLGLQEILIVLCISRVSQIVLILLRIAVVTIVEFGTLAPRLVGCLLLTVCPVAREIHVKTQVFETMYLVVNLYITHVVERVSAVILLANQCQWVRGSITLGHDGIVGIVERCANLGPREIVVEEFVTSSVDGLCGIETYSLTNGRGVSIAVVGMHELTIDVELQVVVQQ